MRPLLSCLGICCLMSISFVPTTAEEEIVTSSCPGQASLPVPFHVDCSHVADPAAKQLCRPFAENQACKVFYAYRKITGINLEDFCPAFTYKIYDKDQWPQKGGELGGYAIKCGANIMADYSLLLKTQIGPYDVHEILHVYQQSLGPLPYEHILFGPSMVEARHVIGDNRQYFDAMTRLKADVKRTESDFQNGAIAPDKQCLAAELYLESSLYLKDPKNVELFYRKLERGGAKDTASRQARFNRMYDAVSGGTAKQYLLSHGCGPF